MNRKELVSQVAKNLSLPQNQVDTILMATLDVVRKTVKSGDYISLIGFGSFTKLRRGARAGVNPGTGEKIQIKAKNIVKFRPGKAFTDLLNPTRK